MQTKTRRVLPQIRKTEMAATFRAPVSRPGADTRPECWGAETTDGAWAFERMEGERYLKWALIYRLPLEGETEAPKYGTLVTYGSSLRSLREQIANGSWTLREADPTDGIWREIERSGTPSPAKEFYRNRDGRREGPACVVAYWFRGAVLRRRVFGTQTEAIAWASSEKSKSAARTAGEE